MKKHLRCRNENRHGRRTATGHTDEVGVCRLGANDGLDQAKNGIGQFQGCTEKEA